MGLLKALLIVASKSFCINYFLCHAWAAPVISPGHEALHLLGYPFEEERSTIVIEEAPIRV